MEAPVVWPLASTGAGAIGAGWALSVDPKLQALMRKVLHAFRVRRG